MLDKPNEIFKSIPEMNYTEPALSVNWEQFEAVLKSRRSVRVYTEKEIPEAVMKRCLEAALLAPNSSNLQCWEFYWVRNTEKKAKLVEACFSQPAARTAKELVVAVARTKSWRKIRLQILESFKSSPVRVPLSALAYYQKLVPFVYEQGPLSFFGHLKKIFFTLMGSFKPVPRGPSSQSEMRIWAHKSVALGCENFMLAMRASGFDTCPMEGLDVDRVAAILDLPSDAEVCMAISCGERATNGIYGPRSRLASDQFIKIIN